jgi:P-type conjugative transfer protein TrbJ
MNDINALSNIIQGGRALAYSLGNLDQTFRQTYPGYGYNAGAYYTQYRNWSQTSLDTTLGTLRAAGLQGQQLQSEQAVLNSLKASLQGTAGRLEAMHALGDISEQQVEQLMKLRELMMADMSSKQAYQAAMIQQHAASEAAAQRFFTYTPATSDRQTFGPGWH